MIVKVASGLALIAMVGVSLYLSPLRGYTAAVVGVFASLSVLIIAVLATTKEKNAGMGIISLEESHAYKTMSNTADFLDLSYMNMYLRKTDEFIMDISSSENQITLSSDYGPSRAYPVKRQPKKRKS